MVPRREAFMVPHKKGHEFTEGLNVALRGRFLWCLAGRVLWCLAGRA